MKFTIKREKNENPNTYSQFTLINLQFINTFQVWSINITILNLFIQILHEKHGKRHNNNFNNNN